MSQVLLSSSRACQNAAGDHHRPIHQRQAPSQSHSETVLTVLIHLSPATLIPSLLHSLLHPSPIPHVLIGCVKGTLTAQTQKSRGFTQLAESETWPGPAIASVFTPTPLDLQVNDAAFRFWRFWTWLINLHQNLVECTSLLHNRPLIRFHSGGWRIYCSWAWRMKERLFSLESVLLGPDEAWWRTGLIGCKRPCFRELWIRQHSAKAVIPSVQHEKNKFELNLSRQDNGYAT